MAEKQVHISEEQLAENRSLITEKVINSMRAVRNEMHADVSDENLSIAAQAIELVEELEKAKVLDVSKYMEAK